MTQIHARRDVVLTPILASLQRPDWHGSVWVGQLQDTVLSADSVSAVVLVGGHGYERARLLIRSGRTPRGFVELPVHGDTVDAVALAGLIDALPPAGDPPARTASPPISVVICTRNRPDSLRTVLNSVISLSYRDFEIVVVDNGSHADVTSSVVREFPEALVRLVSEPVPGLSRARNAGLRAARHDIVAFTDDDVAVDPDWLEGIADGFHRGNRVACVCGIVPTVEISSISQWYFDRRVNWANSCSPELFDLAVARPDEPLFPFQVGRFGTGANFAIDKQVVIGLGGFDEGMGVGSPTGGGEDIDMFLRLLLAGHQLAYEPSALIWHRHRSDIEGLSKQMSDYGTGLGAWLTKLVLQPPVAVMMARRVIPGLLHLRRLTVVESPEAQLPDHEVVADLWRVERAGIVRGPLALLRARRHGAKARPFSGADAA